MSRHRLPDTPTIPHKGEYLIPDEEKYNSRHTCGKTINIRQFKRLSVLVHCVALHPDVLLKFS